MLLLRCSQVTCAGDVDSRFVLLATVDTRNQGLGFSVRYAQRRFVRYREKTIAWGQGMRGFQTSRLQALFSKFKPHSNGLLEGKWDWNQ